MGSFVIASEEAIAKGIRRIVGLTGPEAARAENKANLMIQQVAEIKKGPKADWSKKIVEMGEELNQAVISQWKKDELRAQLKELRKILDDEDKAAKAQVVLSVVEQVKGIMVEEEGREFYVKILQSGASAKVGFWVFLGVC